MNPTRIVVSPCSHSHWEWTLQVLEEHTEQERGIGDWSQIYIRDQNQPLQEDLVSTQGYCGGGGKEMQHFISLLALVHYTRPTR